MRFRKPNLMKTMKQRMTNMKRRTRKLKMLGLDKKQKRMSHMIKKSMPMISETRLERNSSRFK